MPDLNCTPQIAVGRKEPDLNNTRQIAVGSLGPQQQAPDCSGQCRTSTARARSQWAVSDLNKQHTTTSQHTTTQSQTQQTTHNHKHTITKTQPQKNDKHNDKTHPQTLTQYTTNKTQARTPKHNTQLQIQPNTPVSEHCFNLHSATIRTPDRRHNDMDWHVCSTDMFMPEHLTGDIPAWIGML